jgi:hypothetical protein
LSIDHYEAMFDATYLRWFHLNGKPALVEIVRVDRDVEMTMRGGAKKKSPVAYLKLVQGDIKDIKPLVLNRTNADLIAAIYGNKPSEWKGKQIVLEQQETSLKGKTVNCIRVRAPRAK